MSSFGPMASQPEPILSPTKYCSEPFKSWGDVDFQAEWPAMVLSDSDSLTQNYRIHAKQI